MKMRTGEKFLALLLATVMVFMLLPVTAKAAGETAAPTDKPVFGDLPETDELYPYVRYLACQGIMNGLPDGAFRSAQVLTRAEAATVAVLAKKLPLVSGGNPTFSDVPAEHWAYSYIETASQAGLLKGYPDGAFRPEGTITRAEAAALLLRFSGGALSGGTITIADMEGGHWAYRQAVTAVEADLVALSPDQRFNPDAAFNRGEFARCLAVFSPWARICAKPSLPAS